MISVLILTKDEEQDLPKCLKSVSWCDDVHVFDSFSTDRTVNIAKAAGATVTQRKFDSYAAQRNAALQNLPYKYPWLFILDADEQIPDQLLPLLKDHIQKATDTTDGFRLRRRDHIGKKWLKYSQMTPYYVRLVRLGKAHYHREINEVLEVDGTLEEIDGYFNHYPFSKGFRHWLNKHNQYSSMEAKRWVEEHKGNFKFSIKKALINRDFSEQRYHQKGLFYKLPGRPLIKWLYMVFWRLSFLDGQAGLTNATLQAIYEYFIVLKTKELLREQEQQTS